MPADKDLFSVSTQRQTGFEHGSAVEIAALDAGRDTQAGDAVAAPRGCPGPAAAPRGGRGQNGRARGRSQGRGRGRGRGCGDDE